MQINGNILFSLTVLMGFGMVNIILFTDDNAFQIQDLPGSMVIIAMGLII